MEWALCIFKWTVSYERCGTLESPEKEVLSNNATLNWLPGTHGILSKLCLLENKSLHDTAPIYMSKHLQHSVNQYRQHLWWAASVEGILHVAESKLVPYSTTPASMTIAWNKLTSDYFDNMLSRFCPRLRTEHFLWAYIWWHCALLCSTWTQRRGCINLWQCIHTNSYIHTYIHTYIYTCIHT